MRKQDKTMTLLHSCKNNMFICALFVNIKTLLQFQTSLGFHDVFDDEFRGGVSSREVVYRLDHLLVGGPFILQSLGTTVIDVVYLGNLVQSIDPLVTSRQSFLQMRPGSHVLITGPMKFHARLAQPFLHIETPSSLAFSLPRPPLPRSPTRELA